MDYMELISKIFELCIIPLLGVLTTFLVQYLKTKSKEIQSKTDNEYAKKYLDMATDTVIKCVIATNQTYVESLKKEGKFDAEAQKAAFQKTYDAVMQLLGNETKDYIVSTVGDLQLYITQLIEAEVSKNKEEVVA